MSLFIKNETSLIISEPRHRRNDRKGLCFRSLWVYVQKMRYIRTVGKLRTYTADLQNGWKEASAAQIVSSRFAPLFCSRQPFAISPHRFPYAKSYPEAKRTRHFRMKRQRILLFITRLLWGMRNGATLNFCSAVVMILSKFLVKLSNKCLYLSHW